MPNATCEFLSPTRYLDWQPELNAGASIIMIFFGCEQCCQFHCFSHQHSWLKRRSNKITYTTEMIRGETQNSWRINHMFGDILFSTQLLVIHLVTKFSVGDNHDILGIYLACDPKHQNEHVSSWQRERKQELGAKQNVTKHVMVAITDWVSPLIITVDLVMLTWFCRTDHSKKSHVKVTDQALATKRSPRMYWTHHLFESLIIIIQYGTLTSILFQSEFFGTLTVTFCKHEWYWINLDSLNSMTAWLHILSRQKEEKQE